MNIAEFSIKKSVITWALTLVLVVAGFMSFRTMSRLEDPEFTIKDALIITPYPGASAEEVETEVTDVIERAVQALGQLWFVESTSYRGQSVVKAKIKDQFGRDALPQVWDELRRKVNDAQTQLPPGAGPSLVNDDYGDVYGVYLALTGDGYSYAELYDFAKLLRRELLRVTDVKRVVLWGNQPEVVYVEMNRQRMATLGISQQDIYNALQEKNVAVPAGNWRMGADYLPIVPSGEFQSEQQFSELLVSPRGADKVVYLRDVATVRRGYVDPPKQIIRFDGKPAVAIGVSTVTGGNVVNMGEGIKKLLADLAPQTPVGMSLNTVSMQPDSVTAAIGGFMINLIEAVAIVVVVLMIFMGLRSGLIIGGILLLTILGTFVLMKGEGVILERISLGALIIALGMLVDNAIVIIDGMKVQIEAGGDRLKAAVEVVGKNSVPLLGATVVAIVAFAAIGTSKDGTGEYCRSLYQVIMFSLGLSWVTAVTVTPLWGKLFLSAPKKRDGGKPKEPYQNRFYAGYRKLLSSAIRYRWITLGVVAAVFVLSLIGFKKVPQSFFPDSTRPQFFVDIFFPEGTHILETEHRVAAAEQALLAHDEITHVSTALGGGDLRFLLTYTPAPASSGTATLFADVKDYKAINALAPQVQDELQTLLPDAVVNVRLFRLGPGEGGRVQLRIGGSDRAELRSLGEKARRILAEEGAIGIRDEWGDQVRAIEPQVAEDQARRLGISRPDIAKVLQSAYDGTRTGVYRENDELLPIMARAPLGERDDVANLTDLQIWSPTAQRMVPLSQLVTGLPTRMENAKIWRRDRVSTFRLHCDPPHGVLAADLLARVKSRIERELGVDVDRYFGRTPEPGADPYRKFTSATIPVKYGDRIPLLGRPEYFLAWGGEPEDSVKAQASLAVSIPIFGAIMVLTVLFLFNGVKQTLVIWLTVPLALIGVTAGLLGFRQPFGFMALLGVLSLSGMLIKNAIVLIEEIQHQVKQREPFAAVVESGVSRMMPVMMAALTTILGMIPLLADAFFVAMAVAIMCGLLVATLLTLVVVPVLYSVFYRVPNPPRSQGS